MVGWLVRWLVGWGEGGGNRAKTMMIAISRASCVVPPFLTYLVLSIGIIININGASAQQLCKDLPPDDVSCPAFLSFALSGGPIPSSPNCSEVFEIPSQPTVRSMQSYKLL